MNKSRHCFFCHLLFWLPILILFLILVVEVSRSPTLSGSLFSSAFGTAHDKGDMRIIRVHVPPFYASHSVLTSWGTGFKKVQLT